MALLEDWNWSPALEESWRDHQLLSPARGHRADSACVNATADTCPPSAAWNGLARKVHVQGFLFPCFPFVESVEAN